MSSMSRRTFLHSATATMAAAAALHASTAKAAASERVRHAVIGLGSQGRHHAEMFAANPDCEVVALCDLDPERRSMLASKLPKAAQIEDYRRILDDHNVDSISVATPDHWHTPLALAALKAGKHVYVEKPCCHNVREGFILAEAVKKSGKCVQHGTQGRSGQGIHDAVKFMRDGGIGKVRMAKAINHQLREPIGRAPECEPPAGVNYDMWLGPAPLHRFTKNRWHYEWHWFWDYGSGDMGNDGIHQVDEARWGLGVGMPKAVSASGGQLFYNDDHETPDTQVVTFEYDECYLMYEMRLWTDYTLEGHDNGVVFYGDKGTLEIGRNGCEYTLKGEQKKKIGEGADIKANVRNFLDCVKAGNPDGLNAPISEGAISATLCHLGNIATRVGRRLRIDAAKMECIGDDEANKLLSREYRKGYELTAI
jgi:predicted dehydrogenase